ncbi:class A beta-lactamase [Olivibacter sp. SDN3]|uniref:class A beta-lactamase n=1 Tax=Olivibacter sp. SDN3 TaxID=2764720 RepID=UPI00165191C6|nr:class A beta-lactamase [Olivibacter sp. SDN3]QNL47886.1 class A beta-lactamase [Olivibacter sp. SDN3]
MARNKILILNLSIGLFLLIWPVLALGQNTLQKQIEDIAASGNGKAGIYGLIIETGESISFNGDNPFPMQSVYKFPISIAMLDRVDKGIFSLDEIIRIDTSAYIPKNGHSPIRDKFQDGTNLSVRDLLKYNMEESDGTACDVLLELLGGTDSTEQYIHKLGIRDIAISTTEMIQVANDTIQYQNWVTPKAMTQLLKIFYSGNILSERSRALLLAYMFASSPYFDRRIKGLLPPGTEVAHKTGTAGTINGLTRATNDVGIVTLPNGNHLAISVFISDSYDSQKKRELTIAKITRAAFDYWAECK